VAAVNTPASTWRDDLGRRLLAARKARDAVRVSALRTAMSAIDNAETPDGPVPSAGAIAESAAGVGSAEVARRLLSDSDVRALLRAEVDERLAAAKESADGGRTDRAADLRAEADVITEVLDAR
jgi:uncharacterized protein